MVVVDDEHVGDGALEERAVVADDDDGAGPVLEDVLEHAQRVEVEVVRRLVEQQHVRAGPQREHQLEPAPLAAREQPDRRPLGVGVEPEALQEAGVLPVRQPGRAGDGLVDAQRRVEVDAALVENAEGHRRADRDRPLGRRQPAGDDVEQGRLAGAVRADDPEALPGVERQVDAAEQPRPSP